MSSRDILSQEEVDALLNFQGINNDNSSANSDITEELSDQDKDVIGEIGNISMGTAATALFTLLNRKVEITAPAVSMTTFMKLVDEFDRPCVLVEVEYIEGVEGRNVLIVKQTDAAIIADLMMGGDGLNPPDELSEIHMSAVGEAMNQMMGSSSTSLANIINRSVNISPPRVNFLTLDATELKNRDFDLHQPLVKISFRMKIGELVDSHIMQLAPISFVKDLVSTLLAGETSDQGMDQTKEDNWFNEDVAQETTEMASQNQAQYPPAANMQQQPAQSWATPGPQNQQWAAPTQQQPQQQWGPQFPQQPQWNGPAQQYPQQQMQYRQNPVNVDRAVFPEFGIANENALLPNNIELIEDVPLQVTVQLGKAQMAIKDILELGSGSIVELDKLAGEQVDLLVNGKLVAKGEVVIIEENFGFRVKDIISPIERIKQV